MAILDWLLNPSGLTAHGFCLSWAPGLIALHVVSDTAIGLAYFSIPLAIVAFVRKRPDLQYGWVAYLFTAFIVACGTTHLMAILTLWVPAYGVEGLIKLATALLSIATAALLWPLIPKVVALPSATQLAQLNGQLTETVEEQARISLRLRESEAATRLANIDLERRVAERTRQLSVANDLLTEALAQRITAQKALARSEEEFRASFEAAAVGKAQSDPATGRIIRANRAFAHMLGHEVEDLVGRAGWEFTWPEDLEAEQAAFALVLAGQSDAYVREKRYVRKDGQAVWARVSATVIRSPETGEPVLTVAVIEDIDERHKAQMALKAAKQDLERVVEDRTAALTQRDLLLREVYHRVKNNLQIVDSLLLMQSTQVADPNAKEALLGLRGRIYALGLVHHQLMGSKDLKTFDIAPFLRELSANILAGSAQQNINLSVRSISLNAGLDFAIPLALLVTELVSNALKHAFPDGEGTVEVVLDRAENGVVSLVVSDNGVGHEETAAPHKGPKTGLGTRIINGLVAQMGGTIAVKSDNGMRSEVLINAPVLA